jgi:hypothetical protein
MVGILQDLALKSAPKPKKMNSNRFEWFKLFIGNILYLLILGTEWPAVQYLAKRSSKSPM